jgi:hypothetical protein
MTEKSDSQVGFVDDSGALFLLKAREQKLVKLLLKTTLNSEEGRLYIATKLNKQFLNIAKNLLKRIEER